MLTPGGLYHSLEIGTGGIVRYHNVVQESAEGIVGRRKLTEGLNGIERQVGTVSYG